MDKKEIETDEYIKRDKRNKCFYIVVIVFIMSINMMLLVDTAKERDILTTDNQNLIIATTELESELDTKNAQIDELVAKYTDINNKYSELKSADITKSLSYIEPLKQYDKKQYLLLYKSIMSEAIDQPETIYDFTTGEEFDLICRIVEAEIGNGCFDSKVNVANTLVNRYYSDNFPNNWIDIVYSPSQYSTLSNGAYKKVTIKEDTILAIEYAFSIEDTTQGSTYFHSGSSRWHEDSLEFVFEDADGHKFYKLRGDIDAKWKEKSYDVKKILEEKR